ncbi:MAG: amidohydrolase family protein [Candidatus Kapabacteria bacterium]|nr:amidohydrolase family protein [Candidatus Kapabacteria bacterium]
MVRLLQIFAVLAATASVAVGQISTTPIDGLRTKDVRAIALTNCTVVPEPGVRIDSAVILVRNERIVAVGKLLSIPKGYTERNMAGAWLYPGFVDPYVDVSALNGSGNSGPDKPWWEDEDPSTPPAKGIRHWNQAIHPEMRTASMVAASEKSVEQFLAQGITAAAVHHPDGILRGTAAAVLMRPGTTDRTVIADNVYHGMSFRKGTSKTPYPSSQMGAIALLRQAFLDARWYDKARAVAQRNPGITPPEVNQAHEALAAALASNMLFIGETQDEHDIRRWQRICSESSIPFAIKGTGLEYRRLADVAAMKPRLILPVAFPDAPDVRDPADAYRIPLTDLIHWYWAADNARLLDSVGVPFAFTSDGLKDRSSFLANVRLCVQRGLDTTKALAALTTVAADLAGVADRVGKIAPGFYANIVASSGPIFAPSSDITSTFIAGHEHVLVDPVTVDIRGSWTLSSTLFPSPVSITIAGSPRSPSPTALVKGASTPITMTLRDTRLTLAITTDSSLSSGVIRAVLRADSILMTGAFSTADGQSVPFVLRRDSSFREAAPVAPRPIVRRSLPRTLPLGPFGLDSLPEQESVLITNATVWTSTAAGVLENTDVLMSGGVITAIGKGLSQTGSARKVIDGTGKHVTAGIIDEHSHIAISRGVNEGTHAVTTEVRIGDVLDPDDVNIYRQLAGGVTSTHLLHGSANPMGGQLQYIKLRWGADAEGLKFENAKPTVKFALGENVKQSNWGDRFTVRYPQTRMGVEEIMRDGFRAALEYEADLKRTDSKQLPPRRDLQMDALLEIVKGQRNIHCHSYVQSEILMLMRLTEEFGFKVHTFTHILEGYKIAREMARHGVGASSFADWWAYKFEVYDAIPENPAILHEQGVNVSINSDDAEMARRLNQEAAKSVRYGGVSERDAWNFVTINAAKQMDAQNQVGSLEEGKVADVVVWSGNPLSNMSRVERTFVDGREYFSRETDARLRSRDAELRRFLEQAALTAAANGATTTGPSKGPRRLYHCDDIEHEAVHSQHGHD